MSLIKKKYEKYAKVCIDFGFAISDIDFSFVNNDGDLISLESNHIVLEMESKNQGEYKIPYTTSSHFRKMLSIIYFNITDEIDL